MNWRQIIIGIGLNCLIYIILLLKYKIDFIDWLIILVLILFYGLNLGCD